MCKLQNLPKELTEFFKKIATRSCPFPLKPNEMNRK